MEEEVIRVPVSQREMTVTIEGNERLSKEITEKVIHQPLENEDHGVKRYVDQLKEKFNETRRKVGLPPWPQNLIQESDEGDKRKSLFAPTREQMEMDKLMKEVVTSTTTIPDKINPTYYNGDECLQAVSKATINKSGTEGFLVGNIIKYLWRYESKGGLEDVKKAEWYLTKLIEELDKKKG